jgi:hypothetical protein
LQNLQHRKRAKEQVKIYRLFYYNASPPNEGIYYDGQIYDAYVFASDLIKSAKKSIILIDNYVDDTVLTMLSKRAKNITAVIHTAKISKQLSLDLQKHNEQYPKILIKTYSFAHDRFLILDNQTVYHIGASLKDLGKKMFAFSKINLNPDDLINRLDLNQ